MYIYNLVNEKFKKFHFGVCEVRNKPRCLPGNVVSASSEGSSAVPQLVKLGAYFVCFHLLLVT